MIDIFEINKMNKINGSPIVHGGENFHVWQEPTNRYISKNGVHLTSTYILRSIVKKNIQHISLIHDVPTNFPYFIEGLNQYGLFE